MRNCSGQGLDRLLDVALGEVLQHLLLGAAPGAHRLEAAEAAVEVQVLDVVELGLLGAALAGPVGVDERVGQDPVQPGLEVGALLEGPERPVRLEVGLLDQVLGVGGVARHAQGRAVERAHVLHRQIGELGLVGHAATLPLAPVTTSASPRAGRPQRRWPGLAIPCAP